MSPIGSRVRDANGDAGVQEVWAGIRRDKGMERRKVRAARTKLITTMVAPFGDRLADTRDRALLLIGFAGALRRSELVALDVDEYLKATTDSCSWSGGPRPTKSR